ncbi:hypothetical protein [Desulfovibrio psychrotolerans]|uniref:Uncharacterized protein n=1 Tax=Desulfovibrio psychrotolerans TaxID=415242 RepID=A0A7J0BY28_9BACT|nr:hypothetical protein [Desulfovibrio psychrotolerans]GFM38606.1 hypothetical protein DSM19430T_32900 [Desulfovibrio psychrotolerans]
MPTSPPVNSALQRKLAALLEHLKERGVSGTAVLEATCDLLRAKKGSRPGGGAENIARTPGLSTRHCPDAGTPGTD